MTPLGTLSFALVAAAASGCAADAGGAQSSPFAANTGTRTAAIVARSIDVQGCTATGVFDIVSPAVISFVALDASDLGEVEQVQLSAVDDAGHEQSVDQPAGQADPAIQTLITAKGADDPGDGVGAANATTGNGGQSTPSLAFDRLDALASHHLVMRARIKSNQAERTFRIFQGTSGAISTSADFPVSLQSCGASGGLDAVQPVITAPAVDPVDSAAMPAAPRMSEPKAERGAGVLPRTTAMTVPALHESRTAAASTTADVRRWRGPIEPLSAASVAPRRSGGIPPDPPTVRDDALLPALFFGDDHGAHQ